MSTRPGQNDKHIPTPPSNKTKIVCTALGTKRERGRQTQIVLLGGGGGESVYASMANSSCSLIKQVGSGRK